MAFKITSTEKRRFAEMVERFTDRQAVVVQQIAAFNEALNEQRGKVEDELAVLNEVREEMRGFIEDIHNERCEVFDDKSEGWQEGDRGEVTRTWLDRLDELQGIIAEDIAIEFPEELPEFELDSEFQELLDDGLPAEPEY